MKAKIRKIIVQVDEIHQDGGKAVNPPTRRALAMAVIAMKISAAPSFKFLAMKCCQAKLMKLSIQLLFGGVKMMAISSMNSSMALLI